MAASRKIDGASMPTLQQVATDAFPKLVETATNQSTITYGVLADRMIETNPHPRFDLPHALSHIWRWCENQDIPHINALVVRKDTGIPGSGYKPDGCQLTEDRWRMIRDEVHRFSRWPELTRPEHWPPI